MDNVIYHSKDLDGLMSGAIVHHYQTGYWEPCTLHPYDYGENLDTRKFKGKSAVMIDVSMPMDRMELLSTSCMEFMWIDHHFSAYNDLIEYCEQKEYKVIQRKINDLILCTEVNAMNMTYYYSNRLSGCEIASIIFDKDLSKNAKKVIQLLGQYDTWRMFDDKKFINDDDWNNTVLPFQYGMRAKFNDPEKISDYLERLGSYDKKDNKTESSSILQSIIDVGEDIIIYQEKIDETNIKNNSFEMDFDFKGNTYKAICLNSTVFNSNVFKSVYYDGYHDLMLAFQYCGKNDKFKFTLYTTKDEVNILEIAKSFGGGGHKQACGFEVEASKITFNKKVISIFNNQKSDIPKNIGHLDFFEELEKNEDDIIFDDLDKIDAEINPPIEEKKPFRVPAGYMLKTDEDGHNYWIPIAQSKIFEEMLLEIIGKEYDEAEDQFDAFNDKFSKYDTGGAPELCPEFLKEKLKHKL